MDGEPVEVLHDLPDVGPEFARQVLDLVEHRLKPTETYFIRRRGEDALEFTPDDRTTELLCIGVPDTLENGFTELFRAVFEEVEATAVVERIEIVLDDLWVI